MRAALKIVAAKGCLLEEAEAQVWKKAVERKTEPGVVGAMINLLREHGPLKTDELFDALKASYPKAAREVEKSGARGIHKKGGRQVHKRERPNGSSDASKGIVHICDYPLRNKLMKIRSRPTTERKQSDYAGKDTWAIRNKGQVRRWHARSHKFNPKRGRIYGHHA